MESKKCIVCGKEFYKKPVENKIYWESKKCCSKECGNINRRKRIKLICVVCGKEFEVIEYRKNAKYCSLECNYTKKPYWTDKKRPDISEKAKVWAKERLEPYYFKKGEHRTNTGRTRIKSFGDKNQPYSIITINGKNIKKHRYIIEKIIGRTLNKKEIIHHINGDKQDNRIENLYICKDRTEHTKIHIYETIVTSNIYGNKNNSRSKRPSRSLSISQ